ncbi:MAG: T9SS type A sorting domain-containing protein [Bacteroidia bacterium]|nr:T9SS type A sorting domain-containing protein [Bacteroidia bacterium]
MKNSVIFTLLILGTTILTAQTIDRSVIGAYGASGTAGAIQVDMTVGEVAITTGQAGSIIVTQGFHQPGAGITGIADELGVKVDYSLYPNPTSDLITLELTAAAPSKIKVEVIDARGRLTALESKEITLGPTTSTLEWNTENLAEGFYMIVVKSVDGNIAGSFRFQKR